jgi:SAM-dependent methyltransferase
LKARLLEFLGCPDCHSELAMTVAKSSDGEVMEGRLQCVKCSRNFEIRRGIPRLLPTNLSADEEKTARAFGYEWRHFVEMHDVYEKQFLDWIHSLQPDFFKDKMVLDAGCGIGRHAYFAAKYGAHDVVAMDLSDAVETCFANAGHLPNVHVVQADIYHLPFRGVDKGGTFDFVYAIGVLHHIPDPEAGFRSLVGVLKSGGAIFGWVYGYENNGFIHYVVDPIRKAITSRLPPGVVNAVSWPVTVVLQAVVKGVYRPLHGTWLGNRLPLHEYLYSLSFFSFRQNHSIVFDHLIAPIAFYLKREDFEGWFKRAGLEQVELSWRNQNSWRGFGRVPEPQAVSPARTS